MWLVNYFHQWWFVTSQELICRNDTMNHQPEPAVMIPWTINPGHGLWRIMVDLWSSLGFMGSAQCWKAKCIARVSAASASDLDLCLLPLRKERTSDLGISALSLVLRFHWRFKLANATIMPASPRSTDARDKSQQWSAVVEATPSLEQVRCQKSGLYYSGAE